MKNLIGAILVLSIICGSARSSEEENVPASIRAYVAIKIPKIAVEDGSFREILEFIKQRTRELDPNKPGGISYFMDGFESSDTSTFEKKVNYTASDIRVDHLLTDMARLFHAKFHVTSVGMVITPVGGRPFPNLKAPTGTVYYTYKG